MRIGVSLLPWRWYILSILSEAGRRISAGSVGWTMCFLLKTFILVHDPVCGLRSPSFESSSVLYISPADTSSMQNLILEGLQQKLQKSCSRCNKNTRHVESSYILQPPKYLLLFVNRFRYIENNVTKDRCPIPMDTTVRLGINKWIDTWVLDSNRRMGVWSLPWSWHILSIPLTTGPGTSAETCGLDDMFPPDDLGSRPEALC